MPYPQTPPRPTKIHKSPIDPLLINRWLLQRRQIDPNNLLEPIIAANIRERTRIMMFRVWLWSIIKGIIIQRCHSRREEAFRLPIPISPISSSQPSLQPYYSYSSSYTPASSTPQYPSQASSPYSSSTTSSSSSSKWGATSNNHQSSYASSVSSAQLSSDLQHVPYWGYRLLDYFHNKTDLSIEGQSR